MFSNLESDLFKFSNVQIPSCLILSRWKDGSSSEAEQAVQAKEATEAKTSCFVTVDSQLLSAHNWHTAAHCTAAHSSLQTPPCSNLRTPHRLLIHQDDILLLLLLDLMPNLGLICFILFISIPLMISNHPHSKKKLIICRNKANLINRPILSDYVYL